MALALKKPRITAVPFLIPRWAVAQVLFPGVIFLRRGIAPTPRLIAHELAHIDQIQRMGLLRYWVTYLVLLARHGYNEHPMEQEAHRYENDLEQLKRARRLLGIRKK